MSVLNRRYLRDEAQPWSRMAEQIHRIVTAEESDLHDEPHLEGHRITVRQIAALVEDEGLAAETVSDRYDLPLADVYRTLTYYHDHPEEMERVERERRSSIEDARERGVPILGELRERNRK